MADEDHDDHEEMDVVLDGDDDHDGHDDGDDGHHDDDDHDGDHDDHDYHDDRNDNGDDDGGSTISKTTELRFRIATRLQPNNK